MVEIATDIVCAFGIGLFVYFTVIGFLLDSMEDRDA